MVDAHGELAQSLVGNAARIIARDGSKPAVAFEAFEMAGKKAFAFSRLRIAVVVQRDDVVAARFPRQIHRKTSARTRRSRNDPFAAAELAFDVVVGGVSEPQMRPLSGIERLARAVLVHE